MVRLLPAAVFALALAACGSSQPAPSGASGASSIASLSGGAPSLQTPPFSGADFKVSPAPPKPANLPEPTGTQESASFAAIASTFDPGKQHFVWVLPPGVHGKGPWDLTAIVSLKDEKQFETTIPLKAELAKAGSRPEYPAGYEIVRLTNDGSWAQRTAEIDKVIQDLIARHGRGNGKLEMTNQLVVSIDPDHHKQYCVDNKPADVHLYMEEDGAADLVRLDADAMAGLFQMAVRKACDA